MADFKKPSVAPQSGTAVTDTPCEGPTPTTGFADAPVAMDEQGNFGVGEAIPPSGRKMH